MPTTTQQTNQWIAEAKMHIDSMSSTEFEEFLLECIPPKFQSQTTLNGHHHQPTDEKGRPIYKKIILSK